MPVAQEQIPIPPDGPFRATSLDFCTTADEATPTPILLSEGFCARFEVDRTCGVGAMGMVVKALDRELGRTVAIKFLKVLEPALLQVRFQQEARLMATLRHPNLVSVYDVGEVAGHPYMVTEFMGGGTLHGRIVRSGAMQPAAAIKLILPVLDGLTECHSRSIYHRDVKPGNVLFSEEGAVKLGDFGIARPLEGYVTLTATGTIIGTPGYMAPEQFSGTMSASADVYAAGVILYEMIAGRRPYEAQDLLQLVRLQVAGDPMPLARRVRDVSTPLSEWVQRAISQRPEDRPTAEAFATGLRTLPLKRTQRSPVAGGPPPLDGDTPPPLPRTRPNRWKLGLPILFIFVLLVGILADHNSTPQAMGFSLETIAQQVQSALESSPNWYSFEWIPHKLSEMAKVAADQRKRIRDTRAMLIQNSHHLRKFYEVSGRDPARSADQRRVATLYLSLLELSQQLADIGETSTEVEAARVWAHEHQAWLISRYLDNAAATEEALAPAAKLALFARPAPGSPPTPPDLLQPLSKYLHALLTTYSDNLAAACALHLLRIREKAQTLPEEVTRALQPVATHWGIQQGWLVRQCRNARSMVGHQIIMTRVIGLDLDNREAAKAKRFRAHLKEHPGEFPVREEFLHLARTLNRVSLNYLETLLDLSDTAPADSVFRRRFFIAQQECSKTLGYGARVSFMLADDVMDQISEMSHRIRQQHPDSAVVLATAGVMCARTGHHCDHIRPDFLKSYRLLDILFHRSKTFQVPQDEFLHWTAFAGQPVNAVEECRPDGPEVELARRVDHQCLRLMRNTSPPADRCEQMRRMQDGLMARVETF
jgi:serine/threonine protein kinase